MENSRTHKVATRRPSRRDLLAGFPSLAVLGSGVLSQRPKPLPKATESEFYYSIPDSVRVYRDELILTHLNVDEADIELLKQFAEDVFTLAQKARAALTALESAAGAARKEQLHAMRQGLTRIEQAASGLGTTQSASHAETFLLVVESSSDAVKERQRTLFSSTHKLTHSEAEAANKLVDTVDALVTYAMQNKPDVAVGQISPAVFAAILTDLDEAELQFNLAGQHHESSDLADQPLSQTEKEEATKRGISLLGDAAKKIAASGSTREAPFAELLESLAKYAARPVLRIASIGEETIYLHSELPLESSTKNRMFDPVVGVRNMLSTCGYASDWIYVVRITAWVVPLNLIFSQDARVDRIRNGIARILRPLSAPRTNLLISLLYNGLIWIDA